MRSRASRSAGTQSYPCAQFVRFTEEQNVRLSRVAKFSEKTMQAFLHSAAMKAIREVEEEMDSEHRDKSADLKEREAGERRRGLGIRERLQPEEQAVAPAVDRAPAAPSVTINMSAQASDGNDLTTLARGITEAPRYRRAAMLEAACTRLARDARDLDEAKRLAKQLDEEIARLESKGSVLDRVRARLSRRAGA